MEQSQPLEPSSGSNDINNAAVEPRIQDVSVPAAVSKITEEPLSSTDASSVAYVTDEANTIESVTANPAESSTDAGSISLALGFNNWMEDYKAGKVGKGFVKNTFEKTRDDVKAHVLPFFGENKAVDEIIEEDAEAFMDKVSWAINLKGTRMSANGALNIYYSSRRLFDYFVEQGYVEHNVFRSMDPEHIPEPNKSPRKQVDLDDDEAFSYEKMDFFLKKILNAEPEFSAVKAITFIYLSYKYQYSANDLFVMTWDDVENYKDEDEWDFFIIKLMDNYKAAQELWMESKEMKNPQNLVYVQKNVGNGTDALSADSNFAGSWMKHNLIERYPSKMPPVNVNILRGEHVDDLPLEEMDTSADYPILGRVFYYDYLSKSTSYDPKTFKGRYDPDHAEKREQRRTEWEAAHADLLVANPKAKPVLKRSGRRHNIIRHSKKK